MKLHILLFAIILGMCAVVIVAFLVGEVPFTETTSESGEIAKVYMGHGFDHPDFPTMQASGSGAERHAKVLWLGWAYGMLSIGFFLTLLAFGSRKNGSIGPLKKPILIIGIAYAAVFTMMVLSYRGYMNEDTHELFLSFPQPTAWMLFGVWLVPMAFIVVYMRTFDSWTLTEADIERFHALVAERRKLDQDEN